MKKEFIASMAVISILAGAPFACASTIKTKAQTIKKEIKFQNKNFKIASKEIQKGLDYTLQAINALEKNNSKEALKNLEDASKLFEKALKTDPKLHLVPINEQITAYEYNGSVKDIKNSVKLAKEMLSKNNIQFAKEILAPLKDEIDITTHYLPMDLYPTATKIAVKLLKQGKSKKALLELKLGLSTIVGEQVIMPIPLLNANEMITLASNLDKKNKDNALILLTNAQEELQKALLLGYTTTHSDEYKILSNKISSIIKEIKGKNRVESLYKDLKKDFKSLIKKSRKDKKAIDSDSVWNNTKKEHLNALKEENKDIKNFVEKSKTDIY